MENVTIIGSGPAGHTAAIYTARANLKPLMLEGFMAAGVAAGGQLTTTTDIENFPGFPDAISGPDLMERMRRQSLKCGARIETTTVTSVDIKARPFKVFTETTTIETKVLIIATGATAKRLNLPGEEQLWQRGISSCAVCDGALPIFRNKPLAVIGGGDTAAEEAVYLTNFTSKVYLIHRRNELRASQPMQKKIFTNPKIEVIWDTVPVEALGDKFLTAIKLQNVHSKVETILNVSGLFYAIGHTPNTAFLNGQLELGENGYIKTEPGTPLTGIPGVFACGDVQDRRYRQAITAAGSGCMAALEAEKYLSKS